MRVSVFLAGARDSECACIFRAQVRIRLLGRTHSLALSFPPSRICIYTCASTCELVEEFSCLWFLALESIRHVYQDAHTQLVPSDAALLRFSFALLALSPFLRTTPKELWRPGIGIG